MNFLVLLTTIIISGVLSTWALKGNGGMLAWDSRAADIMFFIIGIFMVIDRGARIFNWIMGR